MSNPLHADTGLKSYSRRAQVVLRAVLLMWFIMLSGCTRALLPAPTAAGPIEYHNGEYGFTFVLPASWAGYSIVTDNWIGTISDPNKGDVPALQGPLISIRHPLWTEQDPRQDIPIMVFTHPQWEALQRGEFMLGAAPIGPTELGSNASYVFALPARYNYAFLTGWEEVEKIMAQNPLRTP